LPQVDEKTRGNMYKLRSTWNDVVTPTKLHALDVMIHSIDKNWPLSAAPPNIHVNPKFLNNVYNYFLFLIAWFTWCELQ